MDIQLREPRWAGDPSGKSEMRPYCGLDLLQASSRLDGSGGRWLETLREAPLVSGGWGALWKTQVSGLRGRLVSGEGSALCVCVFGMFGKKVSEIPVRPLGSPGTSLTTKGAAFTAQPLWCAQRLQPALLRALRASQCAH